MNILHIVCSLRAGSESTRLSELIVGRLQSLHPGATVVERNLASTPLAHVDGDYVAEISSFDGDPSVRHDAGSLAASDRLIAELEVADFVVIGTPMHNYTVPSVLKAWVDHVVRARRTFAITQGGKVAALADRPVFVAIASGGFFSGEGANQPGFLSPYLKAILATIGLNDIRAFALQGMVYCPETVASSWKSVLAAVDAQLDAHPEPMKQAEEVAGGTA